MSNVKPNHISPQPLFSSSPVTSGVGSLVLLLVPRYLHYFFFYVRAYFIYICKLGLLLGGDERSVFSLLDLFSQGRINIVTLLFIAFLLGLLFRAVSGPQEN